MERAQGSYSMTANAKAFGSLTEMQQALVLSAYAHELTIDARGGYVAGGDGLTDPQLLRRINEVQHRVAAAILSRLKSCKERYPDEVLINVIGAGAENDQMSARFRSSFRRAWKIAFGHNLSDSFQDDTV